MMAPEGDVQSIVDFIKRELRSVSKDDTEYPYYKGFVAAMNLVSAFIKAYFPNDLEDT